MRLQTKLQIEIEPTVSEVCEVINAVLAYYPNEELKVLGAIQKAITERIESLTK